MNWIESLRLKERLRIEIEQRHRHGIELKIDIDIDIEIGLKLEIWYWNWDCFELRLNWIEIASNWHWIGIEIEIASNWNWDCLELGLDWIEIGIWELRLHQIWQLKWFEIEIGDCIEFDSWIWIWQLELKLKFELKLEIELSWKVGIEIVIEIGNWYWTEGCNWFCQLKFGLNWNWNWFEIGIGLEFELSWKLKLSWIESGDWTELKVETALDWKFGIGNAICMYGITRLLNVWAHKMHDYACMNAWNTWLVCNLIEKFHRNRQNTGRLGT